MWRFIFLLIFPLSLFSQTHTLWLGRNAGKFDSRIISAPKQTLNYSFITLADSLPDGTWKVYTDSTKQVLYLDASYSKKLRTGTWKYYYPNGQCHLLLNYKNGKISGNAVRFSYGGDTSAVYKMSEGKQNGPARFFGAPYHAQTSEKNMVRATAVYRNDTLISTVQYFADGTISYSENYLPGGLKKQWKQYHADGELMLDTLTDARFSDMNLYKNNVPASRRLILAVDLASPADVKKLDSIPYYKWLTELSLSLYSNRSKIISDSLLNEKLAQLKNHKYLRGVMLSGIETIPASVYDLVSVRSLSLINCGRIDRRISNLKNLESLFLDGGMSSRFTKPFRPAVDFPETLDSLPQLRVINIRGFVFAKTDTELKPLLALKQVRSLYIVNCGLKSFPAIVTKMTGLRTLDFGNSGGDENGNSFDQFPADLMALKNLAVISVPQEFFDYENYYSAKNQYLRSWEKKMPRCQFIVYEACFPAGVKVKLANSNEKSIAQIKPGDVIMAYDTKTKSMDTATVFRVFVHEPVVQDILHIKTISRTLDVTPNHPLMDMAGNFLPACHFTEGSVINIAGDGSIVSQEMILGVSLETMLFTPVYTLRTSKGTFVADGVIVHNK